MQGQEYLNQISASSRPAKKSGSNIFSSKIFIVGAVGVILLLLILIIGAMLKGGKSSDKELCYALSAHLTNTSEEIGEFQNSIKSSDLRSNAASLNGVLSNTNTALSSYLENNSDKKDSDIEEQAATDAETAKTELYNELFEAKINGTLDRTFAHKMSYEISLFMIEENKILSSGSSEELTALLEESYKSLENLYSKFDEFSEGQ